MRSLLSDPTLAALLGDPETPPGVACDALDDLSPSLEEVLLAYAAPPDFLGGLTQDCLAGWLRRHRPLPPAPAGGDKWEIQTLMRLCDEVGRLAVRPLSPESPQGAVTGAAWYNPRGVFASYQDALLSTKRLTLNLFPDVWLPGGYFTCPACNGLGRESQHYARVRGKWVRPEACLACGGAGAVSEYLTAKCVVCPRGVRAPTLIETDGGDVVFPADLQPRVHFDGSGVYLLTADVRAPDLIPAPAGGDHHNDPVEAP